MRLALPCASREQPLYIYTACQLSSCTCYSVGVACELHDIIDADLSNVAAVMQNSSPSGLSDTYSYNSICDSASNK